MDAMDILRGKTEGFFIVSSDSDYIRLAKRTREEGLFVMGIEKKKTPFNSDEWIKWWYWAKIAIIYRSMDNSLEANVVKSRVLEFLQAVVIYRDQLAQKWYNFNSVLLKA